MSFVVQCFDFTVAEHLFQDCMIGSSADVVTTTMSGFRCLESYLLYINSEANVLQRVTDTEFLVIGTPSTIRVRAVSMSTGVPRCTAAMIV